MDTITRQREAGSFTPAAVRARIEAQRGIGDDIEVARQRVRDGRTALPSHDLDTGDLRAWAIAVCAAELKHAEFDTLGLIARYTLGSMVDRGRRADPEWHAEFRMPHEKAAALVLDWAGHLRTQEGFIVGPWSRWRTTDRAGRRELLALRRRMKRGFLKAVANYRAARAALETRDAS